MLGQIFADYSFSEPYADLSADLRRIEAQLRENLPDSASPLNFFESPLGRKVVAAEVLATRRDQLLQHSNGLPRQTASERTGSSALMYWPQKGSPSSRAAWASTCAARVAIVPWAVRSNRTRPASRSSCETAR